MIILIPIALAIPDHEWSPEPSNKVGMEGCVGRQDDVLKGDAQGPKRKSPSSLCIPYSYPSSSNEEGGSVPQPGKEKQGGRSWWEAFLQRVAEPAWISFIPVSNQTMQLSTCSHSPRQILLSFLCGVNLVSLGLEPKQDFGLKSSAGSRSRGEGMQHLGSSVR